MNTGKNTGNNAGKRIAFIGNYLPRQCGIATFTTDLCEVTAAQYPETDCFAVAMNDHPAGYEYPERVRFELFQDDLQAYASAAAYLNLQGVDLVSVQHEFGIFGGEAGGHILTLLRGLDAPVVTTLHTVLTDPDPAQRRVMDELAQLSDRLAVMSHSAVEYLKGIYGVPAEKIDLIPHGIPDVPFADPNFYKDKFDVEGKRVLMTFGLLSPNKGIEYAIQALPEILKRHPDVVYLVLGATHPHVQRRQGESYRESLVELAKGLGVGDHVIFHNRFVSLEELVEFIQAADIYVTPYLNPAQIVSGTLAYTVGAGKAVISTPYWYAEELLADGRGLIVPYRDAPAIAEQVIRLLDDERECLALRKRAYAYGRKMIWPEVAKRYMHSFDCAREGRIWNPQGTLASQTAVEGWSASVRPGDLPAVNLDHLVRMTDDTGLLQHAVFDVPNYAEGYTTDDNARALVLALRLEDLYGDYFTHSGALASRYLAFLWYAYNPQVGRFRNFLGFDRRWLEESGSDDSHGRALWGLGAVLGHSSRENLPGAAGRLFLQTLPATLEMKSPRTWAFTLLGIHEYLRRFPGDRAVMHAGERMAEGMMDLYRKTRAPGWYWFEDVLTYNNATLPHALLLSSRWMEREDMAQVALKTLRWLAEVQTGPQGAFAPIGSNGFYPRAGEKARFDQQPVEAGATVSACLEAYRLTGERGWYEEAQRAFEWFLGHNDLGVPLVDAESGGCYDGLHPDRVNRNQGAESTLALLSALTEMYQAQPLSPLKVSPARSISLLPSRA